MKFKDPKNDCKKIVGLVCEYKPSFSSGACAFFTAIITSVVQYASAFAIGSNFLLALANTE